MRCPPLSQAALTTSSGEQHAEHLSAQRENAADSASGPGLGGAADRSCTARHGVPGGATLLSSHGRPSCLVSQPLTLASFLPAQAGARQLPRAQRAETLAVPTTTLVCLGFLTSAESRPIHATHQCAVPKPCRMGMLLRQRARRHMRHPRAVHLVCKRCGTRIFIVCVCEGRR